MAHTKHSGCHQVMRYGNTCNSFKITSNSYTIYHKFDLEYSENCKNRNFYRKKQEVNSLLHVLHDKCERLTNSVWMNANNP